MIYDCFTFFNELDLLEIRLNVLNDVVDRFVLVEATKAHSGKDKPLYFNDNNKRFESFLPKIIHVIVDDYPPFETPWTYENHQRNCIIRGLDEATQSDVILISDLDEIPNPAVVKQAEAIRGIKVLEQKAYYYYLNFLCHTVPVWRCGTKMLTFGDFQTFEEHYRVPFNEYLLPAVNQGVTATKIRCLWSGVHLIKNAGWHFSYLGGIDAIVTKLKAFAHQEFNKGNNLDRDVVLRRVNAGMDPFGGSGRFYGVKLDDSFPKFILDNRQKYRHLIFETSPQYLRETCLARHYYLLKGVLFRFIVFRLIPPVFHPFLIRINKYLQRLKIK
jgi:beta-1,4-mannosyl-glycoprotein beta-1,4-N-acetylglucosaminyltransferase